jgi:hypothetical protein
MSDSLLRHLATRRAGVQRVFSCRCGRPVFFDNSRCLACDTPLGYDSARLELLPLEPCEPPGCWRVADAGKDAARYRRCGNFETAAACNWLVPLEADPSADDGAALCACCALNRCIPDQSDASNRLWWARIELAKRRLVSSLLGLGLPVEPRGDDGRGLAFDLLRAPPGGPAVSTGHADGVITIDVEEADDARREAVRSQMLEPYRTLLGHLRHEVGHYYWSRLVEGSAWLEPFRALFGDERQDYAAALKQHYEQGPPADWGERYVSAYATAHPWEDWAETWAHWLHISDTLDTAQSLKFDAGQAELLHDPFTAGALWRTDDVGAADFLATVNAWVALSAVLNELARSMGQPDLYPFVLSKTAVSKLQFVQLVVQDASDLSR